MIHPGSPWMYLRGPLNRLEHKLRRKNKDETRTEAGFSLFLIVTGTKSWFGSILAGTYKWLREPAKRSGSGGKRKTLQVTR
jgi:hypothetical protein